MAAIGNWHRSVARGRAGGGGSGAVVDGWCQRSVRCPSDRAYSSATVTRRSTNSTPHILPVLSTGHRKLQREQCRCRPGPHCWRAEELLAGLHARLSVGSDASPSIVALHGLAGAGRPVSRRNTHTSTRSLQDWRGFSRPRNRPCSPQSSADSPPSSVLVACLMGVIRWRRCTDCWLPVRRPGCWCLTTPQIRSRCELSCLLPGMAGC